LEDVAKFLI
jgi:DNA-dependent protein kinase catalytic subunit